MSMYGERSKGATESRQEAAMFVQPKWMDDGPLVRATEEEQQESQVSLWKMKCGWEGVEEMAFCLETLGDSSIESGGSWTWSQGWAERLLEKSVGVDSDDGVKTRGPDKASWE